MEDHGALQELGYYMISHIGIVAMNFEHPSNSVIVLNFRMFVRIGDVDLGGGMFDGQARSSSKKWNAKHLLNRHGDCSKKVFFSQTWDWIHWQWIYMDITCANPIRPDIPNLHKPTTLVVHPKPKCKTKTYQNKGIKATKTGRTVLDTSCCILKLKRPLNFLNIKHHDLAIWMDTYQVIRRTNRLKVKVVTKFNTKTCHVFQVWSDHLISFGA